MLSAAPQLTRMLKRQLTLHADFVQALWMMPLVGTLEAIALMRVAVTAWRTATQQTLLEQAHMRLALLLACGRMQQAQRVLHPA